MQSQGHFYRFLIVLNKRDLLAFFNIKLKMEHNIIKFNPFSLDKKLKSYVHF